MRDIFCPPRNRLFEEEEGAPDPPYRLPTPPPASPRPKPKVEK